MEGAALRLGTCSFRHLGWSLHYLHDQHFWGGALFTDWLACGKLCFITDFEMIVMCVLENLFLKDIPVFWNISHGFAAIKLASNGNFTCLFPYDHI